MTVTRRLLILALFAFIALPATSMAAQQWQLVFRYDSTSLSIIKASPIATMTKVAKTPGLGTAPVRLTYNADWYDSQGKSLYTGTFVLPLGMRAAFDDSGPCRMVMPAEGIAVVRIDGPPANEVPASLAMAKGKEEGRGTSTLQLPTPFRSGTLNVDIERIDQGAKRLDGPFDVKTIRYTGPDGNRLVLVILGDGYTSANLTAGDYEQDAAGLENAFLSKSPWDIMLDATNIYRVDVVSNEEGADNDPLGTFVDTYLNSSYWVNDIERLLALTGNGYSRAVNAADDYVGPGAWDAIMVLVNSTKYGGSGGQISVVSVHPAVSEVELHEMGHTFAGLADEYEDEYPGFPPGDPEPNVDYDFSGPGLKWNKWIEAGTPLPTPETSTWANTVGAFEGARYLTSGIYRPWLICLMRALGNPLDPVCKEAHLIEFGNRLNLIDDANPTPGGILELPSAGQTFSVDPLPISSLTYQWYLNGDSIPGAVNGSYLLHPSLLGSGNNQLAVVVTFDTDLVRQTSIWDSKTWTVTAPASCCIGDRGNVDGSADQVPNLADLSVLVDNLFISLSPLTCWEEGNLDASQPEGPGSVTLSDLSVLIDNLFISLAPPPSCP